MGQHVSNTEMNIEYRNAIIEYSNYMQRYDAYVKTLRESSIKKWNDKIERLCERRKFSRELVDRLDIFYVDTMAEMLNPEFLNELEMFGVISPTNNKPIYSGRYVIPIKSTTGNVINLVGYMWDEDNRYMYATGEYYDRADTLYGLENMGLAYKLGWAIVVEGITDCIAIRDAGYENCFAWCGTRESAEKLRLLNNCRYGVIFIKDRDEAGDGAAKHWVTNRYVRLNVPLTCKDADEFLNKCDGEERALHKELFNERIQACVGWLMERKHLGMKCDSRETTILL